MKHSVQNRKSPTQLTDEQRRLVEDNLNLVGFVLSRFGTQGLERSDDTYQTGVMGLLHAAAGYQRDQAHFSTYAVRCIVNELRTERQKALSARRGKGAKPYSLDVPLFQQAVGQRYLLDALADASVDLDGPINHAQTRAFIHRTLQRLDPQHARIIEDYLFNCVKQKELAAQYGYSQAKVSHILQRGLSLLRQHMRGAGYER